MEVKFNEATNNRPEGDRPVDSPLIMISIPNLIKQIKKEKTWEKNDRNAVTVFKNEKMSLILVALHKKAEMTTGRPENVFCLQMLAGRVKLHLGANTTDLRKEELFVLHADISYKIEALKKSVFLLTVAG